MFGYYCSESSQTTSLFADQRWASYPDDDLVEADDENNVQRIMSAASNEDKLLGSLVWSKTVFSLAEFVEKYELPQVVCVDDGYFGESEDSTLSSGQVLTLHSLQHTTKVVCESRFDGIVVIPLYCPLKFRVHPMDCEHASITANQLATVYRHIKYLRVVQGHQNEKLHRPEGSCKADDILKVKQLHSARGLIICTNVFTQQNVFVPYDCEALFAPLLDYREYTLAEVKREFGFPAKVRLLDTKRGGQSAVSSRNASSMSVSSLGDITAIKEIEDSVVISTTMCGSKHAKLCMRIPKDLKIQVVVAEGFMSGDETYQRIVRTLDKGLNKTCLKDFENLDVYQHLDAVKKGIQNVNSSCSVEQASEKAQQLVREHRSRDFPAEQSPPKLLPRQPRKPPISIPPPKLPPKPLVNLPPKSKSRMLGRLKSFNLSMKPWLPFHENNRTKSEGDSEYVEATPKPDHAYETPSGGHTADPVYESTENIYQEPFQEEPDKRVKPVKPSSPPVSNKHEIYQELARIPQDISGLSTSDVSRILRYLSMGCCVSRFQKELVDGVMLQEMDEECLKSLDVSPFHIKKLMGFVRGWRPNV